MLLKVDPATALLVGIIVLIILSLALLPGKGLFPRVIRWRLNNKRILLEDALKYIFDCAYKNYSCGLNSIAGNLNISADKATHIIEHLKSVGLIEIKQDCILLTEAGKSYALKIIRIHRVWERYLADETGVGHIEWHGEADTMEHQMTLEKADEMAARLGNPVFDPHGDPIPSSGGDFPTPTGQPLSTLEEGEIARIIHIEDEPHAIYAQLSAMDLYPGAQVYMVDVSEEKIHFAVNGEECVLTPLFASNITVKKMPGQEPIQEKHPLLSSLKIGEKAEVVSISPKCRGQERRRLMDLGVIPGTVISAELVSASGDPTAYKVMGATIALRKSQADTILIHPLNEEQ
jgi:DtxR family Mn-dependent transcriptional regulator